jgi:ribosomal protein S18 acetylase RimI-like enzyme
VAEFRIRPAVPADSARVTGALAEWLPGERARQLTPRIPADRAGASCFIAEAADGDLAGFVEAIASPDTPGTGYVHFVWVSPEFRQRGVGRGLYRAVLAALRERGCRTVAAVVSLDSPGAIAFHERLGFRRSDGTGLDVEVPATGGKGVVYVLSI